MKKRTIAVVALVLVLLCGCSASYRPDREWSTAVHTEAQEVPAEEAVYLDGGEADYEYEPDYYEADDADDYDAPAADTANVTTGGAGSASSSAQYAPVSRKIIMSYDVSLQTKDFDGGLAFVEQLTVEFDGFVQSSYMEGKSMYDESRGSRYANFTLRIPAEQADQFIARLGEELHLTSKNQYGEDVTDTYYDTEARLDSLKIREERLVAMLEQAEELEYLLEVDRELAQVRYEIESLTSSLQRMDSYVSLSTVSVSLYEVVEYEPVTPIPTSFGERVNRAFSHSMRSFVDFIQGSVLAVIWLLPFLALLAVIVLVVLLIVRKLLKAGNAKQKKAPPPEAPVVSEESSKDETTPKA